MSRCSVILPVFVAFLPQVTTISQEAETPPAREKLLSSARTHLKKGEFAEAIELARRVVESDRTDQGKERPVRLVESLDL